MVLLRSRLHPPGFSMIELMAVVAVIAILSTLTLPSLVDRIVRQQIKEAMPLADIAKAPVAAAWTASAPLPADNAAAGLPAPEKIVGNHVSAVRVQQGAVHMTFGNNVSSRIKGKTLSFRPAVVEDARVVPVAWVCGHAKVPGNMSAQGDNRTDIDKALLPHECR